MYYLKYSLFKMESEQLIILFHPLNTLLTFNCSYLERANHVETFNALKEKAEEEFELKNTITLLPYIQKEVLEKYSKTSLIKHFKYLIESEEEIEVIDREHAILNLDVFFPFSYILKENISNLTQKVIIISENVKDFIPIKAKKNFCKIVNWMIYKETDGYLNHQKLSVPLLLYQEGNYDLIIESFRQAEILIDYLAIKAQDFNESIQTQCKLFFKDAINVLYFFDCSSEAKSYRKRELAQSSMQIKYFPFINKHYGLDNEISLFPKVHVFLQRCPYFYLSNKERCIQIQSVIDSHKEIAQLHNMNVIEMVYNRYALYDYLTAFILKSKEEIKEMNIKLTIPFTLKYEIKKDKSIEENYKALSVVITHKNMRFPFVIKPDSGTIHEMKLILNEDGLKSLFSEKEYCFLENASVVIVQEFIPHGGSMIKNYYLNDKAYTFVRPSLPDMKGDILKDEKLADGTFSFMNEMIYQGKVDSMFNRNYEDSKLLTQINKDIISKITSLFISKSGITLFGLDFLYNQEDDSYSILEVNYFPSYRELGNELPNQFAEHIIKYYSKHKEQVI